MIEAATLQNSTARADAAYASWSMAAKNALMRHDLNERTAGPMPTFGKMVHQTALAAQGAGNAYAPTSSTSVDGSRKPDIAYEGVSADDGFSFSDIIDVINPLQHLPVIGTLYRKFTGDTIKPMSNIIGGAIFGGPVGAVSSTLNVIVKDRTGRDIAENALSIVGLDSTPSAKKPDIDYIEPVNIAANNADSLAIANLYGKAEGTTKNFAAKKAAVYSWNV